MQLTQNTKMAMYLLICYTLSTLVIFAIHVIPELFIELPEKWGFLKSTKSTVEIIFASLCFGILVLPTVAVIILRCIPQRFLKSIFC